MLKKLSDKTHSGCFLAEGVRLVEEVVSSGWPVELLVYTESAAQNSRVARLLDQATSQGLETVLAGDRRMKSLSGTVTPQGVLALVRRPPTEWTDLIGANSSLIVVMDGIQDPGNVGTVIRAADASACDGVICLAGTSDPFAPKAVRASMGSVLHLPVYTGVHAPDVAVDLTARGMMLLVADPAAETALEDEDLRGPLALILGSEARGPGPFWQKREVRRVRIPMPGRAESLNVALAAGIILYEVVRQRSK